MVPIGLLSLIKPAYIPDYGNLVERMSRSIITGLLAAISLAFVIGTVSAATLKQEPPEGALPSGKTVLVDDGSCPAGQIKQVTGGSNVKNGSKVGGGAPRLRKCVAQQ
jgi:hypothetical protein